MIVFRTEAGQDIGFSHLNRCLHLASIFTAHEYSVIFAVAENDTAQRALVADKGFAFFSIPENRLYNGEVELYPEQSKLVITDLQHARNIKNASPLTALLKDMKHHGRRIAFLDAIYKEAYRDKESPRLDALIQPYFGAENDRTPPADIWLAGIKYALLNPTLCEHIKPKQISPYANKILVTFGGADPQGLTATVLEGLISHPNLQGHVKIVIGPYFSHELKKTTANLERRNTKPSLQIEVLENVSAMWPLYEWADIAIGSSGLSRYEFAAMGLPAIFASLYDYHKQQSEEYAATQAAEYLGHYQNLASGIWAEAVHRMQKAPQQRALMSQKGQQLIDSDGGERIFNALKIIIDS